MSPKPEITISTIDADRLDRLLASLPRSAFPGRAALEAELARANIVEPRDVPRARARPWDGLNRLTSRSRR